MSATSKFESLQNILHLDWHKTTWTSRRINKHTDTNQEFRRTKWAGLPRFLTTSHSFHQDRPTKITSKTGKPVRRTLAESYSAQQYTDERKVKSNTISAILTDKSKSSTDSLLGIVLSLHVQRCKDSPPSSIQNDTDKSKQIQYVGDVGKKGEATARQNILRANSQECTYIYIYIYISTDCCGRLTVKLNITIQHIWLGIWPGRSL